MCTALNLVSKDGFHFFGRNMDLEYNFNQSVILVPRAFNWKNVVSDENNKTKYAIMGMGTVMEGPLDKVLEVARLLHEVPFNKGAFRVMTTLKIDDRRDKVSTMAGKVDSVLKLHPKTRTSKG